MKRTYVRARRARDIHLCYVTFAFDIDNFFAAKIGTIAFWQYLDKFEVKINLFIYQNDRLFKPVQMKPKSKLHDLAFSNYGAAASI